MNRLTRTWLTRLAILTLVLIPAQAVFAKGPPDKVIITGPGIDGEIEVTDPALLEALGFYWFNDLDRPAERQGAPPGAGYTIRRYVGVRHWDTVTYYPREGTLGLIYFDGLAMAGSSTEGQGRWFLAKPDGDAAMRQILSAVGGRGRPAPAQQRGIAGPRFAQRPV